MTHSILDTNQPEPLAPEEVAIEQQLRAEAPRLDRVVPTTLRGETMAVLRRTTQDQPSRFLLLRPAIVPSLALAAMLLICALLVFQGGESLPEGDPIAVAEVLPSLDVPLETLGAQAQRVTDDPYQREIESLSKDLRNGADFLLACLVVDG